MPAHHFISYSATDAEEFALKLADDLQAGPPAFPVWIFRRDLHASAGDWDAQIHDAIRTCDSLIFVMSRDSVRENSNCKPEWTAALKYKKPILLVRLHAVDAPFRLGSRQWIDFTGDYRSALAKLRKDLQYLHSPQGELQALRYRLLDAERDLDRATDDAERARILADIEQLRAQIAEQERIVADPDAAARATDERIRAGIERERKPPPPLGVGRGESTKFINPPPLTAPRYFQDRHTENRLIADFLRDESKRLLTINGRAGIGKTAMVCRILKSLESGILPDDLGELRADGIVYLSAIGTRTIRFAHLFEDLTKLLPAETAHELDALYRDPQVSTRQKMLALLEKFPRGLVIVLLDNFESVMDVSECCITDAELDEALRALLDALHHAVKVILTTRVPPRDLELHHPGAQAYLPVDTGLEASYAKQLLRALDADGRVGLRDADDARLTRAVERTRGFPRALEVLYNILAVDRYTTLDEILAAPLPENVVEALVGEAFARLDATAQIVMQGLAAFARPVLPAAVDYVLQPFIPNVNSAPVLNRLVNMQFVHREAGRYYMHPVDREYAWGQVARGEERGARERGARGVERGARGRESEIRYTQYALLRRAADYFRETRKARAVWKTLADLEPQLNEFDLRCAAEDYDTAADILSDIDFDYLMLWGHFRLTIDLHQRLQDKLTDPIQFRNHERMQGQAYQAIGQVRKAIECFERALANARQIHSRQGEARSLGDLGLAYSDLGETRRAIAFYEQALAIARDIGDRRAEGALLGNLGSAYYTLGETRRAIAFYEQALAIARDIGDRRAEGALLSNLGSAYYTLGETRRAIAFYEQALAIDRDIGDRQGEGNRLGNLGLAYRALGETRRAIEFYEQALAIAREIGDRRGEGNRLGNLGNAYYSLGETRRAIEFYEQALAIDREIGDRRGEGADLGNLGNAYSALGETRRAIEFYEQALAIAREIGDRQGEGADLGNLGNAYYSLGETRRAIEFYEQALAIARDIGDRRGEGNRLGNLAAALIDENRLAEAVERAQQSVKIVQEIAAPDLCNWHLTTLALAHLYAAQQDPSGLPAHLAAARAAIDAARQYDVPQNNHNVYVLLGIIALAQRDRAVARDAFTTAIAHADALLAKTPELYDALDAKGIAWCGLFLVEQGSGVRSQGSENQEAGGSRQVADGSRQEAGGGQRSSVVGHPSSVFGHPSPVEQAIAAFRAARAINRDAGVVARVVRKLDALAWAVPEGAAVVEQVRQEAGGGRQ